MHGRQPATSSATTWSWSGPGSRRGCELRARPTGRSRGRPSRRGGWTARGAARRGAALGPARARPGRAPGSPPATACWSAGRCVSAGARRAGLPGDRAVRGRRGDAARRPAWSARTAPGGPARAASWPGYASSRPGDRLRRIDWRVSLRTRRAARGRDPVRPRRRGGAAARRARRGGPLRRGRAARASVLDTTVRAAAAIAEHYLHRGDRVSLLEYGAGRPPAAPGHRPPAVPDRPGVAARRARRAVRRTSRTSTCSAPHACSPGRAGGGAHPAARRRGRREMLARLARSGRFVVAVDTLPADVRPAATAARGRDVAHRLWRLERENMHRPAARARRAGGGAGPAPAASTWCCATWPGSPSAPEGGAPVIDAPDRADRAASSTVIARATLVPLLVRVGVFARAGRSRSPWPAAGRPAGQPVRRAAAAGRRLLPAIAPRGARRPPSPIGRGGRRLGARHELVRRSRIALWRLLGARPRCSTWGTPLRRWPPCCRYDAVVDARGAGRAGCARALVVRARGGRARRDRCSRSPGAGRRPRARWPPRWSAWRSPVGLAAAAGAGCCAAGRV